MRLLHTASFQIQDFNHHSKRVPRYAILSHVWSDQEQSYQSMITVASNGNLNDVSEKIKRFCNFAARLGFDWVWIDTCCINKESSAELSEAINSMFNWYAAADLCVAYLHDVTDTTDVSLSRDQFLRSTWFRRGWTLQELIAPLSVVFVARNWEFIGTKVTLAPLITPATLVDEDALTVPGTFSQRSIIRRFMWAQGRATTRIEDRAYSLLGLFGVSMATIYGEGDRAFWRLQEELLKSSPDQTMFAWVGSLQDPVGLGGDEDVITWPPGLLAPGLNAFSWGDYLNPPEPLQPEVLPVAVESFVHILKAAVAGTPSRAASRWHKAPLTSETPRIAYDIPTFSLTSLGIRARIPLVRLSNLPPDSPVPTIAVLACKRKNRGYMGLFLHRCSSEPSIPLYAVGLCPSLQKKVFSETNGRVIYADLEIAEGLPHWAAEVGLADPSRKIVAEWADIYISHDTGGYPYQYGTRSLQDTSQTSSSALPVAPAWVVGKLAMAGFSFADPPIERATSPWTPARTHPPTSSHKGKEQEEKSTQRFADIDMGAAVHVGIGPDGSMSIYMRPSPCFLWIYDCARRSSSPSMVSVAEMGFKIHFLDALWKPTLNDDTNFSRRRVMDSSTVRGVVLREPRFQSTPSTILGPHTRIAVTFDGGAPTHGSSHRIWDRGARVFGNATQGVRLTLSAGRDPGSRLLDIDVGGSAYGLPPLSEFT